jgi:hypothetical protein
MCRDWVKNSYVSPTQHSREKLPGTEENHLTVVYPPRFAPEYPPNSTQKRIFGCYAKAGEIGANLVLPPATRILLVQKQGVR